MKGLRLCSVAIMASALLHQAATAADQSAPPLSSGIVLQKMGGCAGDNAQWKSDAGCADLTAALQQALQSRGYLASGSTTGPYLLTVTLQRADQPRFGQDMTVTATVQYELKDATSGKVVVDQSVSTSYTGTFPAAPRDAQKLHTENLAGIRQNAAQFVQLLSTVRVGG